MPLRARPLLATLAVIAGLAAPCATVAQSAFHLRFGTTGSPDAWHGDGATLLAETDGGDLLVAGYGASFWTDTGQERMHPLVARIGAGGDLRWQRVYAELENQRVSSLLWHRGEAYLVLERQPHSPTTAPRPVDRQLVKTIALRRLDEDGNLSAELGAHEGILALGIAPVVGERTHFLIAAKQGADDREVVSADVRLLRLDLDGGFTETNFASGVKNVQHLQHVGEQELVFSQWHGGSEHVANPPHVIEMHTDIVRLSRTGDMRVLVTIADGLCGPVVASARRILCATFPSLRTDQTNDTIVAYTPEGRELWRHDLERGVSVRRMKLLDSGDVIYSHEQGQSVAVESLDPSGRRVWSKRLRSAGTYTFVAAIESLADGRLAFLGSTGPWSGYGSTDMDAMVLVTDASEIDFAAPEIVSHVIDSP